MRLVHSRWTGFSMPSTLETWHTAISRVRDPNSSGVPPRSSRAVLVQFDDAQLGATLLADTLPGQKIRMVLHAAHPDPIARLQTRERPTARRPC